MRFTVSNTVVHYMKFILRRFMYKITVTAIALVNKLRNTIHKIEE